MLLTQSARPTFEILFSLLGFLALIGLALFAFAFFFAARAEAGFEACFEEALFAFFLELVFVELGEDSVLV
jgi:hypothetical protein